MPTTLIGQIDKIIYERDEFFVAALKSGERFTAHYLQSEVSHLLGTAITLTGEWENHPNYGKTFNAQSLVVNQNELFFFLNRVVKGFTKKLTADLIEKYSQEGFIAMLENDPNQLLQLKGMSATRVERLTQSWKQFRSLRLLGEFLAPFGVTPTLLRLIATGLKEVKNPIETIKNNPYGLMRLRGIGFKKADEIAIAMNLSPHDPRRIQAAMEYALGEYCDTEGNSCIDKATLFAKLSTLIPLSESTWYEMALLDRLHEGSIVVLPSGKLALDRIYEAETFLHTTLKHWATKKDKPLTEDLEGFLTKHILTLGEQQRHALQRINQGHKLLLLVGYAGTGKSTTAKALLDLLHTRHPKETIMTCALSGIAAQRIKERSGYESSTLQSLLVRFEAYDTLPYTVLLIDEASMINSALFAHLLAKMDDETTLIIVGDDAQLPPIGAGDPLRDFMALDPTSTITLTHIYRQRSDQAISIIANEIRQGILPEYDHIYDDFTFTAIDLPNRYHLKKTLSSSEFEEVIRSHTDQLLASIAQTTLHYLPVSRDHLQHKRIKEYLNHFQVISPMRGNALGVDNLNKVLQHYFNPNPKKRFHSHKGEFRLLDKVVHIRNENMLTLTPQGFKDNDEPTQRRIVNGMCGLLFQLDEDEEVASVYFPNEELIVLYPYDTVFELLQLSYALSVHKVQGMEYENVLLVMSFAHLVMLNTKLLYTAITRAKKQCIIIGESGAFERGCRRLETTKRHTVMQELG
jgi:exodeoxyribonuclease V alpha subunit